MKKRGYNRKYRMAFFFLTTLMQGKTSRLMFQLCTGDSPSKLSIRLGHHLSLLCRSPGPLLWEASRPTPVHWWSRPHRRSCHSRGRAESPHCPAGGECPPRLSTNNKTPLNVKWKLSGKYIIGYLHLPDVPEVKPSPSTSPVLHNGDTSLDSMHRTAVSISAKSFYPHEEDRRQPSFNTATQIEHGYCWCVAACWLWVALC